ncbi:MAG: hypothetical protein FJ138_18560 [Deltaproteobacteria bacterium]|nr:hypothetical protein [Deltaproteobacteria bacterium]
MKTLAVYLALVLVSLSCALSLVHKRARLIEIAYELTKVEQGVKQGATRLEGLKVKRAELIVPSRLERFAGRHGYLAAEAGQMIILERR